VGGQFLNANTDKESFNLYKKEREEILQFIVDQNIGGVIFLSGDRHHTEILKEEKYKEKLGYTFYDITSSPLSAGPSNILKSEEAKNPQRVANTLVVENNYCSIKISGPKKGERVLLITCYDKKGVVKWGHQIKESELKTLKK
jgi:alkaline phosphatase D